MAEHRLWPSPVPSEAYRAWRRSLAWMAVAVAVGLAWGHLRASGEGWQFAVAFALVAYAMLLGGVLRSVDLDVERGRLVQRRTRVLRREVVWSEVAVLRLRHNFAGVVVLQVRAAGALTSVWIPVVADHAHGPRGMPSPVLRLLAGELRRCAPARHHPVADELEAQAAHLEGGGGFLDSPVLLAHSGFRIA